MCMLSFNEFFNVKILFNINMSGILLCKLAFYIYIYIDRQTHTCVDTHIVCVCVILIHNV